jgi:hypothetical protein
MAMKTMKKVAVVTALIAVLALGLSVQPASAQHHHHHGGGNFWGGFGAGAATGLLFGTLAAPAYYPPAYYAPQPVYMAPPAPVCQDIRTEGYWRQVPMMDAGGFTTYRNEWVPGSFQRVCQ